MRVAVILAAGLAAACASPLNPRQELTWDAFKACQSEGAANLERMTTDGNWYLIGREGDVHRVSNCMQAYWARAAREGRVPALPPVLNVTAAPASADGLLVPAPPEWTAGDTWRFASEGPGSRRGAYSWRVQREDVVDGVAYWVLKSGTREVFYRRSDLAITQEALGDKVVVRNTPARLYYVWPLGAGARWEQTYRYERPEDKRAFDHVYEGRVEGEETMTVVAGTFKTLRITYRNAGAKDVTWEQWYSPEVRLWVRVREQLDEGTRVTELQSYELRSASRPAQAPASQSQVRAARVTDSSTSSSSR